MTDQPMQDFMMALLIISTVVFAVTPVFFGFTREVKRSRRFSLFRFIFIDVFLLFSFVLGFAAIMYITIWYNARLSSAASGYECIVRRLFLSQMAIFLFSVLIYWTSSICGDWGKRNISP